MTAPVHPQADATHGRCARCRLAWPQPWQSIYAAGIGVVCRDWRRCWYRETGTPDPYPPGWHRDTVRHPLTLTGKRD